jgi:hypothetical protein
MKRNLARKPTQIASATTESGALDLVVSVGAERSGQDLVDLVWQYFGELISETLMEVQESLATE